MTNQLAAPGGADMDAHRADMLAQAAATRAQFRAMVEAVRALLADQPSPNAVRTTGRRLAATISEITEDIAGGRG